MLSYILAVLVAGAVVGIDQYTKALAVKNFANGESVAFIKGILRFAFCENSGGAWGMLSGYTWLLVSITFVIFVVLFALILKLGAKNKLLFWAITLVLSGGIGNMIDRIFKDGKVVDFLQFDFWRTFPIFNVADCAVVVGAGLLLVYFVVETAKDSKNKKQLKSEINKENESN